MQSGLLTDSFTAERVASLPGDDRRRNAPHFQEPRAIRAAISGTGAGSGPITPA